jgi:hypothetical protein
MSSIARLNQGTFSLASELPFNDTTANQDRRATVADLKALVLDDLAFPETASAYVTPPSDGITGAIAMIQAAHDQLLNDFNGGKLTIAPRLGSAKYLWEKTFFHHPKVKIEWPGKGLADFVLIDHLPLAQYVYRDVATGVVALRDLPARCCIYLIPYAPFDLTGQVITPSANGVITSYEGFTIDGNKTNQDGYCYGIYAPPGKTDPNWPFVAGAFAQNQVTNPGGAVNMNADAQAYYGFNTRAVEIFNTTGTQFFAGADRQRTHLLEETKGTLGGINNPDGSALYIARGYDIQGNDGWVFGGGFGNNNGASQGSGESGMMRIQNNVFPPKGNDAASIGVRDEAVNGSMNVGNVINTLARYEVAAGNPIKARGGGYVGNNFLWGGFMQTSGPNTGRPVGVTTDEGDTFLQFQGYGQTVAIGNVFSVGTDGTTPKYHVSATQGAGVLSWNPATSNVDGSKSYRGTTPWFTDNTLGVIGGGWLDPIPASGGAPVLHIGVSWKGLLAGPNVANTQFVQVDSPLIPAAGIVGRFDGASPPVGMVGEPGANSGTISAITTGVEADVTTLVLQAGEHDLYGEVQYVLGAVSVAAATAYFEVSISTNANTMDRSSARIYAADFLAIPAGGASGTPLRALRVGPLRVSLVANQTYHLVIKGVSISTNTISAAGVLHSRRW